MLDQALGWLGDIIRTLLDFVPHRSIVKTTHGAVKFVGGAKAVPLGPGVHWYWPFWTEFWEYPTCRQTLELPPLTLVTADEAGRTVTARGLVVYEVSNIEALVAQTYHPDAAVRDMAMSAVHDVLSRKTWAEIREGLKDGTLDRELRREAADELKKFGVRVTKTTLTTLAPCKVLRVDSAHGESINGV